MNVEDEHADDSAAIEHWARLGAQVTRDRNAVKERGHERDVEVAAHAQRRGGRDDGNSADDELHREVLE